MKPTGSAVKAALGLAALLATAALFVAPAAAAQPGPRERPALAPAPADALSEALDAGQLTEAEYALERARSLFQLGSVRREFGDVERLGGRDATLVLRDLVVRKRELTGADRLAAEALLARPDQGGVPVGNGWTVPESPGSPVCSVVCVHWVDSTGDAPRDSGYVGLVLATLEDVWEREITDIGYRAPQDDSDSTNNGGGPQLDVYIDDVGSDGFFGYCTSDDPSDTDLAVSAYCVLDDDYDEFGSSETEDDFLRVTAAHEFFHAVQAAYDFFDDFWLHEGTAANMEETVYPAVDDNINFLRLFSPFTRPGYSLDRGGFGDSEYGSWIFWRFLEEKAAGGDPQIVREVWERADAAPGAPDRYSLQAAKEALAARGVGFTDLFARFVTANGLRDYADGALYPATNRLATWRLGPGNPRTGSRAWRVRHLASLHFTFVPRGSVPANAGRLVVRAELPKRAARATVVVVNEDGSTRTTQIRANADRVARQVVRFGRNQVKRVLLVLSNGSTLMGSCFQHPGPPSYSCSGRSPDDDQIFRLQARYVR